MLRPLLLSAAALTIALFILLSCDFIGASLLLQVAGAFLHRAPRPTMSTGGRWKGGTAADATVMAVAKG